jgi:hypothetical protein
MTSTSSCRTQLKKAMSFPNSVIQHCIFEPLVAFATNKAHTSLVVGGGRQEPVRESRSWDAGWKLGANEGRRE